MLSSHRTQALDMLNFICNLDQLLICLFKKVLSQLKDIYGQYAALTRLHPLSYKCKPYVAIAYLRANTDFIINVPAVLAWTYYIGMGMCWHGLDTAGNTASSKLALVVRKGPKQLLGRVQDIKCAHMQ